MKRIACILATCLAAATAHGARPEITVQIADERDAAGVFINWQTLTVNWDESPMVGVADHSPMTASAHQVWVVPDADGNWWRFTFNRNVVGQYAIRYCFGIATGQTVWSEIVVVAIYRGPGPKAQ